MTALCGCVSHEEHIARSAAVRTLGTIVIFPFLSNVSMNLANDYSLSRIINFIGYTV